MSAVEEMKEASIGAAPEKSSDEPTPGFETDRIAAHLESCADELAAVALTGLAQDAAHEMSQRLRGLATGVRSEQPNLEELERTLTVLEEKLFATLLATAAEADLTSVREQASRELAPYKRRMQAVQIRQIEQQFLHKRLLEKYRLPRLSLFYMSQL
jgi:hypothetical protein